MAPFLSSPVLAQVATALSTDPMQLFDTTWLPILLGIVQVASLVFLVIYVIKTVEIAQANRQAAEATQKATEATLLSVKLSEQAVEEMRAARDAQTAPYVVVYLEMDASGFIMRLVMENLGQTAAHDISLLFEPELDASLGLSTHEEWPRFMTGVTPLMAPKQRMSTVLNSFAGLVNSGAVKTPYTVSVSYQGGMTEDAQRTVRSAQYVLDFMSFYGVMRVNENDADKAVDQLEDIAKAVEKLREPIEEIHDRLERGLMTTLAMPGIDAASAGVGSQAIALALVAGLKALWLPVGAEGTWKLAPGSARQMAQRMVEQLASLVPYVETPHAKRERARSILADLDGELSMYARYHRGAVTNVRPILDELGDLLADSAVHTPEGAAAETGGAKSSDLEVSDADAGA